MKKIFLTLLTLAMLFSTSMALAENKLNLDSNAMMNFYHQPNYNDFIAITSSAIENTNDFTLYDFSTMVLNRHPDYANKIVKSFSQFSNKEKNLLFSSLIASHNTDLANEIKKLYHYNYQKPDVDFHTPEILENVQINDNPGVIDGLWAAYSATGDNKYLLKILEYINKDNFILRAANEMLNRKSMCQLLNSESLTAENTCKMKDIVSTFKKRYKNDYKKMFIKAVVVSQAIWSFNSNSQRDKTIEMKYETIIKQHQNLDYKKKINSAPEKTPRNL